MFENFSVFGLTLVAMFEPANALVLFGSVLMGIIFGILPGLSATMAIALLTGLTYKFDTSQALLSLVGVYVGAISGGSQTAILMNIPGTASAAACALDGYPMGKKGDAGLAIFLATSGSFVGTFVSMLALILLTPTLAAFALKFGSYEFFLLALFGVIICGQLTSGGSPVKGWIAGILGLLVSQVGLDGMNAYPRFSFDSIHLMSGISLIPVMIGLFGFPEIVQGLMRSSTGSAVRSSPLNFMKGIGILMRNKLNMARSATIGVLVGIIPGVGEDTGAWLSYWAARSSSKTQEEFGKGNPEGVIAAEAGANACIGGSMIPVLSLAIPGSAPTAVLLAAMWLHNLRPGPLLMMEAPELIFQMGAYLAASAFAMWVLALGISKMTIRVLSVPNELLMPAIYTICVVGAFVIENKAFDAYLMFIFGVIGILLRSMNYPAAPFLLGIVLGPLTDNNLRRSLNLSDGSLDPFFTRPISLGFVIVIAILILLQFPFIKRAVLKLLGKKSAVEKLPIT